MLIANANLVPKWATWETFRELEDRGLTMHGQMTAGSWIYIGTQGILQGTYETLAEVGRRHFNGSLSGKSSPRPVGGMGGAQPLAVTMNGGVALVVEVDPARIEKRRPNTSTRARRTSNRRSKRRGHAREGVALDRRGRQRGGGDSGVRRARFHARRDHRPDPHDPLVGYVPDGLSLADGAAALTDPDEYQRRSIDAMGRHVAAMRELQNAARSRSITATTSARKR